VAIICTVGFVLTILASWAVARVDRNTEQRLLEVQTRQAATVLSAAILVIQQPLTTALGVQTATGPEPDVAVFRQGMSAYIGSDEDQVFVTASLWRRDVDEVHRHVSLGAEPWMDPGGAEVQAFLARALDSSTSVVERVVRDDRSHIAYAVADPTTGFVVYAESAIRADRRSRSEDDVAFADIDYAIYLGDETRLADLTTTDVDPASLPLGEPSYQTTVPFGDTVITFVTTPHHHLGSSLSHRLPLILLFGGLVLTAAATLVTRRLLTTRAEAENNTATISALYTRVDNLYEEQRALSVRLQHALLPQVIPNIPQLEIAAEYVAGAQGVDIGGDWYSIIEVGDDQFAFVVGDVSGRGVDAVAVMAHARFTLRAYLIDGNSPQQALEKCSRQFDVSIDGHMITVAVGVGNARTGEITLANAGHPPPLLVTAGGSEYLDVPVGPPLGVGPTSYRPATVSMPVGSTLVLYTDGLIERRAEGIDVGMRRLADLAEPLADEPVEHLVSHVVTTLRHADAPDDIAVLAFRRADS
jgi:serine phosphatase RsbU (regulator of sigma subunit)